MAGAVFALEVLAISRIQYDALMPCLIASLIRDLTCFGLVGRLFAHLSHYIKRTSRLLLSRE